MDDPSPHDKSVRFVRFVPGSFGRVFLSAGDDGEVASWSASTGELRTRFRGHRTGVTAIDLTASGRCAITGCRKGDIGVYVSVVGGRVIARYCVFLANGRPFDKTAGGE